MESVLKRNEWKGVEGRKRRRGKGVFVRQTMVDTHTCHLHCRGSPLASRRAAMPSCPAPVQPSIPTADWVSRASGQARPSIETEDRRAACVAYAGSCHGFVEVSLTFVGSPACVACVGMQCLNGREANPLHRERAAFCLRTDSERGDNEE